MPLKKKEEVCGKPNQYNLNTLEYDWRELPDTHIQVPPPQPCVRDYSALAGYGAAGNRAHHDNRDHVADLFGDGDGGAGQRPEREPQRRALPPPLVAGESPQALPYPSSGVNGRGDAVHGNAAASPSGPYGADAFNVVWSHEDIKRAQRQRLSALPALPPSFLRSLRGQPISSYRKSRQEVIVAAHHLGYL
ncbi:hypothetical protein CGC20_36315 [Leishmania donovani]|uniref:Uncharacterized protein n=1 Tax=Leishmania donovani TaxID=5661 RepID=A0A504WW44_LEIDO|nr:hypothetical protein CGC20_36315 [Leishmania donovani]